ncbi:hypothetical protein CQW23_29824 [Capsicum baccatum]|uniref:Uncharacterized protein n=1 Tax=Capsicum baccatum TaxID=33114 RepID=A0A2G2VC63_CAPBA|nr:hypothetical protein CQW23_29824 [Capsicum baccatum]
MGRHVGETQDSNIRKRIFKKKRVDGDKSNTIPISGKIVLRHQDVQEKKDVQGLLNNVIEETASKLVEIGKSKDLEAKVDYVSQLSDVDKAKVDYTSQLLDDILSSILSRMTIKDAVKTSILSTKWRYLGSGIMAEENSNELASPVTSVKNDSMAEDNTDELVSLVTSNTRRQSTRKLNAPDSGQDVIRHYVRSSTESCTDLGGGGKKGDFGQQKLSTPPGSVLGEKKKVTGVEQKPSISPGSMLGEAKKRTVVMQNTSTTSRSNQSDAKKGILVKQKLSTPPVNMLEEGKKVNEVYQNPSSPQESVIKDKKEVTMVEQKPSSPPGCMEGGIDEVTMVEQKSSASLVSMLGEGENVTVVEQKLSTPPGSMLVEGKKEVVVNQKPSAPPGSMPGQGKKLNVVDRRPSPKVHSLEPSEIKKKKILLTPKSVHSLKLDSSSDKMRKTEKKMKSSFKILGGVDAGGKKDSVANYRKQIIAPKVSAEKYLKMPTLSSPPKSSSVKPLILRVRSNKSLKLLAPLKDQNKMRRDGTNKLNLEMVPEKTLPTPRVKESPKSFIPFTVTSVV